MGIELNVKNQWLLWDPISEYCIKCKKPTTVMGPICMYCIFENGIMEVIIKNDVNIILIKDVQIWVDQKMLKNPMKKRLSIKDQSSKIG